VVTGAGALLSGGAVLAAGALADGEALAAGELAAGELAAGALADGEELGVVPPLQPNTAKAITRTIKTAITFFIFLFHPFGKIVVFLMDIRGYNNHRV